MIQDPSQHPTYAVYEQKVTGMSDLAGLRCLVIGGGGFLGRSLCERLVARGGKVKNFSRSSGFTGELAQVEHVLGSFGDRVALSNAVEGQDVVFHLVSGSVPESSNRDPSAEMSGGPLATVHLLDICRISNVRKVIFASSGGAIYGIPNSLPLTEHARTDPISAYGISKLTIEKHLHLYWHLHGLDYHSLRIANPYGRFQLGSKRQGLVGTFIHRALAGHPLEIWGDGSVVRDYIHVDDVADAFIEAINYSGPHKIMNVGSSRGLSVNEIIDELESALGCGPLERAYMVGRAADVPINILDTTLIRTEMDWRPLIEWPMGLRDTVSWVAAFDQITVGSKL